MPELLELEEERAVVVHSCESCGSEIDDVSDLVNNRDGRAFHTDCYNGAYAVCERCDAEVSADDINAVHDECLCDDCRNARYFLCDACNEYEPTDERNWIESAHQEICDDCYSRNDCFYCESCGESHYGHRYGEDGRCEDCCENDEGTIRDYSTDATDILPYLGKSKLKFGVELEIECERNLDSIASQVADILDGSAILKHDGSLNDGFEIVTAPADFPEQLKIWERFFKSRPSGMKSYDTSTCGIHIHISKNILSDRTQERLSEFINKGTNKRFVEFIAQRRENRWCAYHQDKKTATSAERYEALNFNTGKPTIEFRIFKGTLKRESFLKNIEFVHALVKFTTRAGENPILSWVKFWRFVRLHQSKYPNLWNFIKDYKRRNTTNEGEI